MITLEYRIMEMFKELNRPLVIGDLLTLGDNREFINKVLRKMIKNDLIERTYTIMRRSRASMGFINKRQFVYRLK